MARNPSVVVPALRRVLMQLTHEVQVSTNATAQADPARLLSALIVAAPRVARPYALAIAVILAPLLSSDSPETAHSTLAAAAALARAAGAALRDHLPSFVAAALATIQDQTATTQREAALDALVP